MPRKKYWVKGHDRRMRFWSSKKSMLGLGRGIKYTKIVHIKGHWRKMPKKRRR